MLRISETKSPQKHIFHFVLLFYNHIDDVAVTVFKIIALQVQEFDRLRLLYAIWKYFQVILLS